MAQRTSGARLEEWARLLGASVPECTADDATERERDGTDGFSHQNEP